MTNTEIEVTDEQHRTIMTVLYAVMQADSSGKAVWFDPYDREKIGEAFEAIS